MVSYLQVERFELEAQGTQRVLRRAFLFLRALSGSLLFRAFCDTLLSPVGKINYYFQVNSVLPVGPGIIDGLEYLFIFFIYQFLFDIPVRCVIYIFTY